MNETNETVRSLKAEDSLILVIDDEEVMREGCSRICESIGCRVTDAEGGAPGLSVLEREDVDVILLDLMMPGISGMEVLERIMAQYPQIVVIVITGYATVELAVEAMKKGAYDFIAKPFSPDQLRIVLHRALEKRRLEKEADRLRRERARSLRDVAEEQSRLRAIIDAMADGVVVAGKDGVVVLYNRPAAVLLGIEDDSMIQRPVEDLMPKEAADAIAELTAGPVGETAVLELETEGGRTIRSHTSLIFLEQEGNVGSVTMLQDITPLKEMDRLKSQFVAMASHELRSPLAAIQQILSVVVRDMKDTLDERRSTLLDRAQERSKGLMAMINDLLDLAKIESGGVLERKEPVELEPLARLSVEFYQETAHKKGVKIDIEPFAQSPCVMGDCCALEEVFGNLISNAVSYTPSGGSITIKGGVSGDEAWVSFEDTGIGIPPEAVSKIFDRFYRVKDEKTRNVVGTGLGLPIVKGIVEAHDGKVELTSTPGKGSTFRVILPAISMNARDRDREIDDPASRKIEFG